MTTDRHDDHPGPPPEGEDDREIAMLLRLAGRAPELPESEVAPIRAAVRAAWRHQVRRRTTRRRAAWLAAAALAASLVAVALLIVRGGGAPAPPTVASIDRSIGTVTVHTATAAGTGDDRALGRGAVITTGDDGRVAVRLASGGSLRLDRDSRVHLDSSRTVVLERGGVYLDSGDDPGVDPGVDPDDGTANGAGMTTIVTPLGPVTDIGTRFEVRLLDRGAGAPGLRVRVRDGRVRVATGAEELTVDGGEELSLTPGGDPRRAPVQPDDPAWRWASDTAPMPDIEGATLASFLDWVARETGTAWTVDDPGPSRPPAEIVLHGSVEGLTPPEALDVVLAGSGLTHRLEGGEIRLLEAPPRRDAGGRR